MVAIYSIMTVKTLQNNNDQKLRIVEEANKKTEELLSNMEHVANAMKTGIDDIYEKIDKLSELTVKVGMWVSYEDITNEYMNSGFVGTMKVYIESK